MPSRSDVQAALGAVKRAADFEYFFEKLSTPGWIRPLEEEGIFAEPQPLIREAGLISFPFWPQSRYLTRMASLAPDEVMETILRIPATDNTRIHEDFIGAALTMPAGIAAKIVPSVKRWITSPVHLLMPDKAGKLMAHLARGGQVQPALALARSLLAVRPDPRFESSFGRHDVAARFDDWHYKQILERDLPALERDDPVRVFDLLADTLEAAVAISEHAPDADPREDHSSGWQPAVEVHEQNRDRGLRSLLVRAVTNVAERLVEAGNLSLPEIVRHLEGRRWKIFSRISHHLAGKYLERDLSVGRGLVLDASRMEDITYFHEYWLLARRVFPVLSPGEQESFLELLEAERAKHEAEATEKPDSDDENRFARHWLFRRLTLLNDILPPAWQARYQELASEFPPIPKPDLLIYTTGTWVGPTSPKSSGEISSMSVDELVDYLHNWEPSGQMMDDTPEGLGRQLAGAVKAFPEQYAPHAMRFAGLDPTYVRACLSGLKEAFKEKRFFDWSPVLDLCDWVVTQERTLPGRSEEDDRDRDPDWGWTRKQVADLVSAGFSEDEGSIPESHQDRVWRVLKPLTEDPDPTPEHERRYGGDNMDPFTLSINTVRGEAMHAVMHYALWVRRHFDKSTGKTNPGFAIMPEVQDVLERRLRVDVDPSLTIRAVVGRWFSWIVFLDPVWTRTKLESIFPKQEQELERHDAAWEAFLLYSGVFNDIFEVLRPEYGFGVTRIGRRTRQKGLREPDARLAEHLMVFFWRGRIGLADRDALLQAFFDRADPELQAHAIAFVGRSLYEQEEEKEQVPEEVLTRLQALFEWRLGAEVSWQEKARELAEFGWWFASGRFPSAWSLPTLLTVLRSGRKLEAQHLVVKKLARMRSAHLAEVTEALRWVVEVDERGWESSLWVDEGRAILESALSSQDQGARAEAAHVINLLAARGDRTYVALLSVGA